jgi:hypothetical protein
MNGISIAGVIGMAFMYGWKLPPRNFTNSQI